ncbi:MAG: hypothetical protein PHY08_13630 [Candidatus Cloacimonetes bacterium]|nr:hypothetical protein [Candidatus Cloacimonadota bacterium]
MKKIICIILVASLTITSIPLKANAKSNEILYVDGYEFNVTENNGKKTTVYTTLENGDKIYATLDKSMEEISLEFIDYPQNMLGIGIGMPENTKYDVTATVLTSENINAKVINTKTKESINIKEYRGEVTAQNIIFIPIAEYLLTASIVAALQALLMATATIVVAGVIFYAASKVMPELRAKQPSIKYYKATLQNGNVYIGAELTTAQAASYLKANMTSTYPNNIFAYSSTYALSICNVVSPIHASIGPEKHGEEGYYSHYHPRKDWTFARTNRYYNHCWY